MSLLATAQTVVIDHQPPIHWEAVLVTAVPATLAMLGSLGAALIGRRNHQHLQSIDQAVNGVEPGQPTLREKVETIQAAVDDGEPGTPTLRENVQELTARATDGKPA